MRKTWLIACREYLAFVRTVGFWLSLLTVPLIFGSSLFLPLFLRQSATPQAVAVLDLSGERIDGRLREAIRAHGADQGGDGLRLTALPAGLMPDMTLEAAEAKMPGLLRAADDPPTVLIAYTDGGGLHFHIWSEPSRKGRLARMLSRELGGFEAERMARAGGVDPRLARRLYDAKADIVSLTPNSARKPGNSVAEAVKDNGPRVLGAVTGYITWMAIFSSSMILLGSVIEEKSSKVLEVLLASASTTNILVGKVLGVAMVLLTVTAIWVAAAFGLGTYGLGLMKSETLQVVTAALGGLFTPAHLGLLLVYFITGYLMFGVMFAAIGAFCETQKDAQAVMGPVMIVLMIPLFCMQTAFVSGEVPILRYLSWVPVFTPFLMPLRLAQPLPWYEIAGTLAGMGIVAVLMIRTGGKAFRHGALTGERLSWGALLGFGRRDV